MGLETQGSRAGTTPSNRHRELLYIMHMQGHMLKMALPTETGIRMLMAYAHCWLSPITCFGILVHYQHVLSVHVRCLECWGKMSTGPLFCQYTQSGVALTTP